MMGKNQIQEMADRLSTLCIFRGVRELPLFRAFRCLAKQTDTREILDAYSAFAEEIYKGGGSLTSCVRRAVLENENMYVTALASGKTVDPYITESAMRELAILSDFAAMTAGELQAAIPCDLPLASFASTPIDLCAEYTARLPLLSKLGYGMFASCGMFRLSTGSNPRIEPILSGDPITLDSFIGYHEERAKVLANTQAFVDGRPAANVLLYGDAGTGKSSTVKAVANHFFDSGIRLIELRKDQMAQLPFVMEAISRNPLKFIIFIDDLSFQSGDDSFSMLKAALEGSASAKSANAVIYATSNRRHIVRESFEERDGSDVHRNDTMQELLSLSARFGLSIQFGKPNKALYLEIVRELAQQHHLTVDPEKLAIDAEAFALRRGHRSARCAEQFINSLL